MEELLQAVGHSVQIVSNGREALNAIEASLFDLVLMDIQMPEMDGINTTKLIRNLIGPAGCLPIIAVTANVSAEDRESYVNAGMDAVLAKPFAHTAFHNMIDEVYARRRPAQHKSRAAA